jgi:hypothetical protein
MRKTPLFKAAVPLALLSACVLAGCEDPGTGALDPRGSAPFLASGSVTPDSVNLELLTPGPAGLPVSATASVRISDRDQGGSLTATVEAYAPGDDVPVASSVLRDDGTAPDAAAGDGMYTALLQFSATRADAGRFTVRFSAVDELGLRGNTLEEPLVLTRRNSPPVVSDLVAPDTVALPGSGSTLIELSIVAADSDGYADIRDVYFQNLDSSNPLQRFFLRDDGGTRQPPTGDDRAGDGRFGIIIQLPSSAAKQDYRFSFRAIDVPGDTSAAIVHILTVR